MAREQLRQPRLTRRTMDVYGARKRIRTSLLDATSGIEGVVLDVGAGDMPYREILLDHAPNVSAYVGVDLYQTNYGIPDVYWDGFKLPIASGSVDCAIATEVLEHVPDALIVVEEVFRALKPGGLLFISVPFLWPLHDVPHDEYRYTPFSIRRILTQGGFRRIEIHALGGWDAAAAQFLALWVRRKKRRWWWRYIVSTVALPIVWLLDRMDADGALFDESQMVTGLICIVRK